MSVAPAQPVKIVIIGAGNVGATTAYAILLSGLAASIVLIDVNHQKAAGEAMDLNQSVPFALQTRVWAGTYGDCRGAAIVIIAAGLNQRPGQSRMELLNTNAGIFRQIIPQVTLHAPDTILLVATNPVDVLTYVTWKISGFPINRVIGSGTLLDSARFRSMLGAHFHVDPQSIHADIVGEHGDSEIPVWSLASIAGMNLPDYCKVTGNTYDHSAMIECFRQTRDAAYDIIRLKGVTNYAVAAGLTSLVQTILRDQNTIVNVSTVTSSSVTGGARDDVCISRPTRVNRSGAYQVLRLPLTEEEQMALSKSIHCVKDAIDGLDPVLLTKLNTSKL
jgi:L-lactate dehydrogenase